MEEMSVATYCGENRLLVYQLLSDKNQNLVAPIYYLKCPKFSKKFRDMQRNKMDDPYLRNYA